MQPIVTGDLCPACGGDLLSNGTTERCAFCPHSRDLSPEARRKFLHEERICSTNQKKNGRIAP
jgi:hypothetical protein